MTSVILLLLVLLLVLVNGYFVAAEFAVVRTRASRMQGLADEGDRRAKIALEQLDHVDEYVATSQVGITLASLAIGFLGEPAIAKLIEPALDGWVGHAASAIIAVAIAFSVVTYLSVVFTLRD